MEKIDVVNLIRQKFNEKGNLLRIPLLKGDNTFEAQCTEEGLYVDNLGNSPFLPWSVFTETVNLLQGCGGYAVRGAAQAARLGDDALPFDSVEGHIASKVYGKQRGDSVFRRITPVACVLIWAEICRPEPGKLVLNYEYIS